MEHTISLHPIAQYKHARTLIALLALAVVGGAGVAAAPAASAATATNTVALTAVVAIPADLADADNTWTSARIASLLAGANDHWSTESNGAVALGLPNTVRVVHTAAFSTDTAKAFLATVAREQSFANAPWKGLVVFTPASSVIAASGGNVGAATYGNGTKNGGQIVVSARPKTDVALQNSVTHEVGHYFSIPHANRLGCDDGSVDSLPDASGTGWANAACQSIEYDDNNDIMSNAYSGGAINSVLASSAGFVKSTDILDVTATGTTADYTLRPWADKSLSTTKAIRIADPATGNPIYVELRQPVGLDAADAVGVRAGVKILKKDTSRGGSLVLDPSPTTARQNTDGKQTWDQGSVFVNASQTVAVVVGKVGTSAATVSVTAVTPKSATAFRSSALAKTAQLSATATTGNSYYGPAGSLAIVAKDAAGSPVAGTVTVSEGSATLGTATVAADGTAIFAPATTTAAGDHRFTLTHSDPSLRSGTVDYRVAKAASTIRSTASDSAIALSVTIGQGSPLLGTVTVSRDGEAAGSVALTKANGGTASYALGALAPGAHTFAFAYAGSANTEAAQSSLTVTVADPSAVASVVGTSAGATAYYTPGSLAITAKTAAGAARPGTVTVYEGSTVVGSATVPASGTVTFALPKTATAGTHSYRLVHSDASVRPGTASQVVTRAATVTALTPSTSTVAAGDTSATVRVSASIPGSVALIGTVTVTDNGVARPAVALTSANKGVGSYAVGALSPGAHTIVFTYTGAANTEPSTAQVVVTAK